MLKVNWCNHNTTIVPIPMTMINKYRKKLYNDKLLIDIASCSIVNTEQIDVKLKN